MKAVFFLNRFGGESMWKSNQFGPYLDWLTLFKFEKCNWDGQQLFRNLILNGLPENRTYIKLLWVYQPFKTMRSISAAFEFVVNSDLVGFQPI